MIKFKIKGEDEIILVAGSKELVTYLHRTARFQSETPEQYMLDYSRRSVLQRDIDLRATDYDSFVEDLVKNGDIEILLR